MKRDGNSLASSSRRTGQVDHVEWIRGAWEMRARREGVGGVAKSWDCVPGAERTVCQVRVATTNCCLCCCSCCCSQVFWQRATSDSDLINSEVGLTAKQQAVGRSGWVGRWGCETTQCAGQGQGRGAHSFCCGLCAVCWRKLWWATRGRTERQTDKQTDKGAGRQADRQAAGLRC